MGFLKHIFGGFDVAPVPREVGQTAQDMYGYARNLYGQYGRAQGFADRYAPQASDAFGRAAGLTDPAIDFAQEHARDSQGWYRNHIRGLVPQTYGELSAAGSPGRQEYEANRARADFDSAYAGQIGNYNRGLARAGINAGSGVFRHNPLQSALGRAASGNNARFRERMYGEEARRQQLPGLLMGGNKAFADTLGASDAASQQAQYLSGAGVAPASIYGSLLPMGGQYFGALQGAQEGFGNQWNAANSYNQAKAASHKGMWDNITATIGAAVGAGGGGSTASFLTGGAMGGR